MSLRNDEKSSRFINETSNKLEDQIAWLKEYKKREAAGTDFYIICMSSDNKIRYGLNRIYDIKKDDWMGALAAILLHDIGHGPFSHALENSLVEGFDHESISLLYMKEMNKLFDGQLDTAIDIFCGKHPHKFLHQLVASQLDMDRLDYLRRDSFFTGVTEGVVGSERIIKMLRVIGDKLVVDRKGIYSIEKFIIARRLMYWQVYLHKTVIVAEQMLVRTFERAKILSKGGEKVFATPALKVFLNYDQKELNTDLNPLEFIEHFSQLDDNDILSALKVWQKHSDPVLAILSEGLLNRKLLRIEIQRAPFSEQRIETLRKKVIKEMKWDSELDEYLVFTDMVSNSAYNEEDDQVSFWDNSGKLIEFSEASDIINPAILSQADNKYFLCYPKWIN